MNSKLNKLKNITEGYKQEEKICVNCKHLIWMVGIGQGLKCGHPSKATKSGLPKSIPSKFHSCKSFQSKEKIENSKMD